MKVRLPTRRRNHQRGTRREGHLALTPRCVLPGQATFKMRDSSLRAGFRDLYLCTNSACGKQVGVPRRRRAAPSTVPHTHTASPPPQYRGMDVSRLSAHGGQLICPACGAPVEEQAQGAAAAQQLTLLDKVSDSGRPLAAPADRHPRPVQPPVWRNGPLGAPAHGQRRRAADVRSEGTPAPCTLSALARLLPTITPAFALGPGCAAETGRSRGLTKRPRRGRGRRAGEATGAPRHRPWCTEKSRRRSNKATAS